MNFQNIVKSVILKKNVMKNKLEGDYLDDCLDHLGDGGAWGDDDYLMDDDY